MSAKWAINYDNAGWVALQAEPETVTEELNGIHEAVFTLPNSASNRTIVGSNRGIQILFSGSELFLGTLYAPKYGHKTLECVTYDAVYELMKKRTISGEFNSGSINELFGSVATAAGVPYGTTGASGSLVSVRFDEAYCYDSARWLASTANQDFWVQGGTAFLGSRGAILDGTLDYSGIVSDHQVDRAKVRSKVRIRGVDVNGLRIFGEAGAGSDVAVFTDKKGCDLPTLNLLAKKKLDTLSKESSGITVKVPVDVGVNWSVGNWKAVQIPELALDGTYRIYKNTAYKRTCEIEIDRAKSNTEEDIDATGVYEELGIYKLSPSQMSPLVVALGGMRELYHLDRDCGTVAINSAPIGTYASPNNGVISAYSWDTIGQLVSLHLSDGSIVTTHPAYTDCRGFSITAWTSPLGFGTTAYSDSVICGGAGVFDLGYSGTGGSVAFQFVAGSTYRGTMPTQSGTFTRNFVVAVYNAQEGSAYLYYNGTLRTSFAAGTNLITLPTPTYWGYKYHGYLGEASLWSRALSAQEVQELYFFPLTRVVATGGGTATGGLTPTAQAPEYSGVCTELAQTTTPIQITENLVIADPTSPVSETITEALSVATGSQIQSILESIGVQLNPPGWTLTVTKYPPFASVTLSPSEGTSNVSSGLGQVVIATESQYQAVKGFWVKHNFNAGSQTQNGVGSVTVGPYIAGLSDECQVLIYGGWELIVYGSTLDGTDQIPFDEASMSYYWNNLGTAYQYDGAYLDGALYSASAGPLGISAKSASTSHTLEFRSHHK